MRGVKSTLICSISAAKQCLREYRYKAKKKCLPWELTFQEFYSITQQPCYLCHSPPSNMARIAQGHFIYNGIDRVDNERGYERDNVRPCCAVCNWMKGDMLLEFFKSHIRRIMGVLDAATQSADKTQPKPTSKIRRAV